MSTTDDLDRHLPAVTKGMLAKIIADAQREMEVHRAATLAEFADLNRQIAALAMTLLSLRAEVDRATTPAAAPAAKSTPSKVVSSKPRTRQVKL